MYWYEAIHLILKGGVGASYRLCGRNRREKKKPQSIPALCLWKGVCAYLSFHEVDCNICFGWACCALRICWLTAVVLGILQSSAALLKGSRQGYNRQQRNCWRPSMVRSLWGRCRPRGSGALLCWVHWYHGYWGQRYILQKLDSINMLYQFWLVFCVSIFQLDKHMHFSTRQWIWLVLPPTPKSENIEQGWIFSNQMSYPKCHGEFSEVSRRN